MKEKKKNKTCNMNTPVITVELEMDMLDHFERGLEEERRTEYDYFVIHSHA